MNESDMPRDWIANRGGGYLMFPQPLYQEQNVSIAKPRPIGRRKPPPQSIDEAIAAAQQPPDVHLTTPTTPMKIVPRDWIDAEGVRVTVHELGPLCYIAAFDRDGRKVAYWPTQAQCPDRTFALAQAALDRSAAACGMRPDPPLEPEDDGEPAPVRSNGNGKSPHAKAPGRKDEKADKPHAALAPLRLGVSPASPAAGVMGLIEVPIDLVDPNPWQPRQDFGEEEIEELKTMILAQGLLNPPVARRRPGDIPKEGNCRYELAAGERRLRACKALGKKRIPLFVRDLSDREMREVAYQENQGRKDLNAIEKARELKAMLDAGDHPTQEALAKSLGCRQGTISNAVRLLELPEAWQQRIISGEITPKHASCLLPYKDYPSILAKIDKAIGRGVYDESRDCFKDLVLHFVDQFGRAIRGPGQTHYDCKTGRRLPAFVPSEEQQARYKVTEVPRQYGAKGTVKLAMNPKAYDRDEAAWLTKCRKEIPAKGAAKRATASREPLSPAAAKKQAQTDRKLTAAAAEKALDDVWETGWLWLISLGILDSNVDTLLAFALAIGWESGDLADLGGLSRWFGVKPRGYVNAKERAKQLPPEAAFQKLAAAFVGEIHQAAAGIIAREFWIDKQTDNRRPGPVVQGAMELDSSIYLGMSLLEINFESAWIHGELEPIYRPYFESREQAFLLAYAEQAGVEEIPAKAGKPALVKLILAAMPAAEDLECGPPLPEDLAERWKATQKWAKVRK